MQDFLEGQIKGTIIGIWIVLILYSKMYGTIAVEGIDANIQPFVNEFVKQGQDLVGERFKLPNVNIIMGRPNLLIPEAVGVCMMSQRLGQTPIIIISPSYWNNATEGAKENLIFHELSHCILHRPHSEKLDEFDRPLSMMFPSILDLAEYNKYRKYYIKELFCNTDPNVIYVLTNGAKYGIKCD